MENAFAIALDAAPCNRGDEVKLRSHRKSGCVKMGWVDSICQKSNQVLEAKHIGDNHVVFADFLFECFDGLAVLWGENFKKLSAADDVDRTGEGESVVFGESLGNGEFALVIDLGIDSRSVKNATRAVTLGWRGIECTFDIYELSIKGGLSENAERRDALNLYFYEVNILPVVWAPVDREGKSSLGIKLPIEMTGAVMTGNSH